MGALPINWELVSNPINWVTVMLMIVIFGFLMHELLPQLTKS